MIYVNIGCEKLTIEGLDKGYWVFDENADLGLVTNKAQTYLHKHLFIEITWFKGINNDEEEKERIYFHQNPKRTFNRIYFIEAKKKKK